MKILVSAKNQAHTFDAAAGEKILYAGLRAGVELPYECATGTCGTCRARVLHGDVVTEWPEAPGHAGLKRDRGDVLMCQAVAGAECALEVPNSVKTLPPGACLPVHLDGVLRRCRPLTHDVLAFEVDLERPLEFEAGQFVVLTAPGVPGGRAYSMVNYERRAQRLAFVAKRKPGGRLSQWLFDGGAENAPAHVFGPLGHAIFHPELSRHLLLVAGGSGIAGMMSILARACEAGYFRRHQGWVFFGVRTGRDVFFLDELAAFRARGGGGLQVTVALSEEEVDPALAATRPSLAFARGLVHAVAAAAMKGRFATVRAYAAGPPPMVEATLRMLLLEGKLTADNIRYDKFS